MKNRSQSVSLHARKTALALLCGAAIGGFAVPASASPQYLYHTVVTGQVFGPPGPAGTLTHMQVPAINDKGFVAFASDASCEGGFYCQRIYTDVSGTLTPIIDGGKQQPSQASRSFTEATINQGGAVAFGVLNFSGTGPSLSSSVSLWKNGVVKQIAPTQPTVGSTIYYANPRILNNSKVLFSANHMLGTVQNNKAPKPVADGYCSATDGTGSALNGMVAVVGSASSGGVCNQAGVVVSNIATGATELRIANDGTYGTIVSVTISQKGVVVFGGRELPGRATHVDGLFTQQPGQAPVKIAEIDNGQCTSTQPATPCIFRTYDFRGVINVKGQTLSNVRIYNWNGVAPGAQPPTVYGVVLNGDIQNGQIAWPGMVIDGCNVASAQVGSRSLNKLGQIALLLTCNLPGPGNKQNNVVVVATPSPNKPPKG